MQEVEKPVCFMFYWIKYGGEVISWPFSDTAIDQHASVNALLKCSYMIAEVFKFDAILRQIVVSHKYSPSFLS